MKVLFWNIGDNLTNHKLDCLKQTADLEPDIFCIAEGTPGYEQCKALDDIFSKLGYICYYRPSFIKEQAYNLPYDFNAFGLKIFYKKHISLSEFSYTEQKLDGRIISLKFEFGTTKFFIFFIHATAKTNPEIKQVSYIIELNMFIASKLRDNPDYGSIIMGDFNANPWEDNLRMANYINSYFHIKEYQYYLGKKNAGRLYFNPFFEYIQSNSNKSLLGTFYKNSYISLLDFVLLTKEIKDYTVNILTKITGDIELLQEINSKNIISYGFDHLPIELNLISTI